MCERMLELCVHACISFYRVFFDLFSRLWWTVYNRDYCWHKINKNDFCIVGTPYLYVYKIADFINSKKCFLMTIYFTSVKYFSQQNIIRRNHTFALYAQKPHKLLWVDNTYNKKWSTMNARFGHMYNLLEWQCVCVRI